MPPRTDRDALRVVDYLIKPFQFPRFEEVLTTWRRVQLITGQPYYEQADVDAPADGGAPEASDARKPPKGLTAQRCTLCRRLMPIRMSNSYR